MEDQGLEQYIKHMVDEENTPLAPGPAFAFVQAIEAVNLGNLFNPLEVNFAKKAKCREAKSAKRSFASKYFKFDFLHLVIILTGL